MDVKSFCLVLLILTVGALGQNECISAGGMCFSRFCPAGRSRSYRMPCRLGVCCFQRSTAFVPCLVFGGQCKSSCGPGSYQLQPTAGCEDGICCSYASRSAAAAPERSTNSPWWSDFVTTPRDITTSDNTCGYQALTRIIYGPVSKPCAWPWLAAIRVGPPLPHLQRYKCAGVLVDDDTVITVAHCFDDVNESTERIEIVIGESDQSSSNDYDTEIRVRQVIKHPDYDKNLREADLAVLKLDQRVTITTCSVPVCLANKDTDFPKDGLCTTAGWGRSTILPGVNETNKLRSARVSLMDEEKCQTVLQYTRYRKPRNTLCIDNFRSQRQPCWGDQGGMLACLNEAGEYQLRGLMQRQGCEFPDSPSILLRISDYTSWIKSHF